jgi:hypothetical protein
LLTFGFCTILLKRRYRKPCVNNAHIMPSARKALKRITN